MAAKQRKRGYGLSADGRKPAAGENRKLSVKEKLEENNSSEEKSAGSNRL